MARRPSLASRLWRILLATLLATVAGSVLLVLALRWLPVPQTSVMLADRVAAWRAGDSRYEFAHDWVAWERLPASLALAVIAAEDQKFLGHGGFDIEAIDQALDEARRGRRQRGASTLSQQVAKNLFLWHGRSWPRKGLEAWFTVWIEALWPKRRILEVYLNSAEFGRGVYGAEAAARRYFRKPAAQLSRQEAALLAAALPSPRRLRVDRPSPYLRQRQQWILRQMDMLGGTAHLRPLR